VNLSDYFMVTILFMQNRVKVKVLKDDTLELFLHRIRNIIGTISNEYQIGLFDIYNSKSGHMVKNFQTADDLIVLKAPLTADQIIKDMIDVKQNHIFLVLYINSIDFGE
jgi:hypothetical protein